MFQRREVTEISHDYHSVSVATGKPLVQVIRNVAGYTIAGVLLLFCLVSISPYVVQVLSLFRLDEAGYGDSYILYDVHHFQKTGFIYRNLTEPPFLPALYSPLVYVLYSIPGRILSSENPFVAPRVMAIAAFIACVLLVMSIVRALFPSRLVWVWGVLLPFSSRIMPAWILQLRGDYPGIFLSLLAVRFLLSESRWAVLLAGVCAGLAMQMKITFIAAAAAGAAWLAVQQRWRDVGRFLALAAVGSAGLYILYSFREPRMFSQILAISPGIRNLGGNLVLMDQVVSELLILLAVVGLAGMEWRAWPRESLVSFYLAASFAVAALTAMQAGANKNYYLETLFASVPVAVLGVFRLMESARRNMVLGLALTTLIVIHFLVPASMALYYVDLGVMRNGWIESGNDELRRLSRALTGARIFSTVPRLALLDPAPPLMEPYMLSYFHRLGKVDMEPLLEPVRRNEYDVVITYDPPFSWRNVTQLDPDLRSAIAASYRPYCTFHRGLFHLPNRLDPARSDLAVDLDKIGCSPVSGEGRTNW